MNAFNPTACKPVENNMLIVLRWIYNMAGIRLLAVKFTLITNFLIQVMNNNYYSYDYNIMLANHT